MPQATYTFARVKIARVKARRVSSVVARGTFSAVFVFVVAAAIGCDTSHEDCTNGAWRCDSSFREIQQCVDHKWQFVELCVGPNNFCRSGQGFDCHGPNTACCDVLPQ